MDSTEQPQLPTSRLVARDGSIFGFAAGAELNGRSYLLIGGSPSDLSAVWSDFMRIGGLKNAEPLRESSGHYVEVRKAAEEDFAEELELANKAAGGSGRIS